MYLRSAASCVFTYALLALMFIAGVPLHASAQANYRTVIIVGDTQSMLNLYPPANYADFTAMIDWIIANKNVENIDFVLHVGDIIDIGSVIPLPPECEGTPTRSERECQDNECTTPLLSGCYPFEWIPGSGNPLCLSCSVTRSVVDFQWSRFNAQWSRLEPNTATGWSGIPYGIVRGNHDNLGVDPPSGRDVFGYAQYYSEAKFESLEQAFAGNDRHFEHLETYPNENQDGHVWRFRLGSRPVLVVGPSYEGGGDISQTQIDWVKDVFGRYSGVPAILLVHDMMERWQLYNQVVTRMATVAPQLFMTAQGHVGQDRKSIDDHSGYKVLRTVSDWSRTASPEGSYLGVVRFYFDPAGVDRVEAFSFSPVTNGNLIRADNTVALQPFGIDQDPDHDCILNPNDSQPFVRAANPACSTDVISPSSPETLRIND